MEPVRWPLPEYLQPYPCLIEPHADSRTPGIGSGRGARRRSGDVGFRPAMAAAGSACPTGGGQWPRPIPRRRPGWLRVRLPLLLDTLGGQNSPLCPTPMTSGCCPRHPGATTLWVIIIRAACNTLFVSPFDSWLASHDRTRTNTVLFESPPFPGGPTGSSKFAVVSPPCVGRPAGI